MNHPVQLAGTGLDLEEVLRGFTPLQRDLMRALLTGEDDAADAAIAAQHGITLFDLRRLRDAACLHLRRLVERRGSITR